MKFVIINNDKCPWYSKYRSKPCSQAILEEFKSDPCSFLRGKTVKVWTMEFKDIDELIKFQESHNAITIYDIPLIGIDKLIVIIDKSRKEYETYLCYPYTYYPFYL